MVMVGTEREKVKREGFKSQDNMGKGVWKAVLKKNKKFDLIKRIFVSDLTEGLENPSAVFRLNQSFPGAVRLP